MGKTLSLFRNVVSSKEKVTRIDKTIIQRKFSPIFPRKLDFDYPVYAIGARKLPIDRQQDTRIFSVRPVRYRSISVWFPSLIRTWTYYVSRNSCVSLVHAHQRNGNESMGWKVKRGTIGRSHNRRARASARWYDENSNPYSVSVSSSLQLSRATKLNNFYCPRDTIWLPRERNSTWRLSRRGRGSSIRKRSPKLRDSPLVKWETRHCDLITIEVVIEKWLWHVYIRI